MTQEEYTKRVSEAHDKDVAWYIDELEQVRTAIKQGEKEFNITVIGDSEEELDRKIKEINKYIEQINNDDIK